MTDVRTALLAAAMAIAPLAAHAWQAENYLSVNPMPGDIFEVIAAPGSAGPDFWCAAGNYALRVLGASGTQRIYIVRGRGPAETSGRTSGVQFSLTPPPGGPAADSLFLKMTRVGDNLGAAFAQNYCNDRKNLEF